MSARLPELEWAHRAAAGALVGLDWVEPGLDPEAPEYGVEGEGEALRFRGAALGRTLPPALVEAAMLAVEAGEAPLLDGVARVLARAEWTVVTRERLWTPLSPAPGLLARLVEAYGVGVELHRGQPERLARLAARLPSWHPGRGRLEQALALLAGALDEAPGAAAAELGPDGAAPGVLPLTDEVLAGRDLDWWAARAEPGARPVYRIERGWVRFQPVAEPGWRLIREDLLVAPTADAPLSTSLLRLMPVWTSLRVIGTNLVETNPVETRA